MSRHRCQRGGKYKSRSKGLRNRGASLKVKCKCYVGTLEHPITKKVIFSGVNLIHTEPCNPSLGQQMIGRVKSGRNFRSMPFQVPPLNTHTHTKKGTRTFSCHNCRSLNEQQHWLSAEFLLKLSECHSYGTLTFLKLSQQIKIACATSGCTLNRNKYVAQKLETKNIRIMMQSTMRK